MPLMLALVDGTNNQTIPLACDTDGRLIVAVTGMEGLQFNIGAAVEVSNDEGNPIPVSGPLSDVQLRAAAVPVSIAEVQIGTPADGVAQLTGASGLFGWLSGILSKLSGVLSVSGSAAVGSAPSGPPVSVAGVDAGGLKRHLATDNAGNLQIITAAARAETTVAIASGASVSSMVDLQGAALVGFSMPAAWTAAALNIEVSSNNVDWSSPLDSTGAAVSSFASPTVSAAYALDVISMLAWRYIRFRSGTTATPVNQGAARPIRYITRPLA
jgi:hypothetical protein